MRRRLTTQKLRPLFSLFPSGRAGAALLLLRALLGFSALGEGGAALAGGLHLSAWTWGTGLLIVACGILLLTGFFTPIACVLFALHGVLAISLSALSPDPHSLRHPASSLSLVVVAAAVALLGPGALSVDARLFGMREIVVSRNFRAPGN